MRSTALWTLRTACCLFATLGQIGTMNAFAAPKDFTKPAAQPAKAYPAHDDHPAEKTGIAADPYDTAEKEKIFTVHFLEHDLLPVFFVVTNDSDQPISVAHMQVTLITRHHSKLTPVMTEDIVRRLSNPQTRGAAIPLPVPIPQKKVKGLIGKKEMDEIESSQFAARAVEPHGTQSGFLYFDTAGLTGLLAGSYIDITGVDDAKGNELMYFEIEVDKYLDAAQKKN
jgi:hypothetical protein